MFGSSRKARNAETRQQALDDLAGISQRRADLLNDFIKCLMPLLPAAPGEMPDDHAQVEAWVRARSLPLIISIEADSVAGVSREIGRALYWNDGSWMAWLLDRRAAAETTLRRSVEAAQTGPMGALLLSTFLDSARMLGEGVAMAYASAVRADADEIAAAVHVKGQLAAA
jgi:hypothetical protein